MMALLYTFLVFGVVSITNVAGDSFVYRSYQTTIYCNASTVIRTPADAAELLAIVQEAIATKQTLKAFGSRHSITDVICTNGIPISMEKINYARVNPDGTATFGAGIKLDAAMEFLETNNLSLITVPTYGGISVGGAIGTGAHGTSLRHPSSLSDQATRMTVILGNGTQVDISGAELDLFRVHLGLLGILVDVTLATVPLFKMSVENINRDDSVLFDGSLPTEAAKYDFFQLWWFPQSSNVVIGTGNYTSADSIGLSYTNFIPNTLHITTTLGAKAIEIAQATRNQNSLDGLANFTEASLYKQVFGKPPMYTEDGRKVVNPATGYAWRLQSDTCKDGLFEGCSWFNGDNSVYPEESSVAFDISQFTGVMKMMQAILKEYPASFPLVGIYIRFAKASPATMAISSGRTTFTVEWATPMRKDPYNTSRDGIATYEALLQEMVTNYGGRPHWGKNGLYYTSEAILGIAVPNRQKFVEAMQTYDPNGIFLNAFGRRMLGISDAQDRDPQAIHCALQDYCTCHTAEDCAPGQRCSEINGFPVCMDTRLVSSSGTAASAPAASIAAPDPSNLTDIYNHIIATATAQHPVQLF